MVIRQGISRREFARRDGCSEGLVRHGLLRGKLIAFDDGSIDASLVGTPWRDGINRTATNGASALENQVTHVGHLKNANGHATASVQEGLGTYAEAQRVKENYLAKLRQLEFEVKSGHLIEGAVVDGEIFEIFRALRDALTTWPARIAPLIAAELQTDQIALTLSLENHVKQFLSDVGEPKLRGSRPGDSPPSGDSGVEAGTSFASGRVGRSPPDIITESSERAGAVANGADTIPT